MPKIFARKWPVTGEIGVWKITEPEHFFLDGVQLYPEEINEITGLGDRKLFEWYVSRHLLHSMSGREIRAACLKDKFGKPYILGSSWKISMSHSGDLAAAVAAPSKVGIDIQHYVDKLERIAVRVFSEAELMMIGSSDYSFQMRHIFWGAKEAIFKAYGRKGVDFRKHIFVGVDHLPSTDTEFKAIFDNGKEKMEFSVYAVDLGEAMLVAVHEI